MLPDTKTEELELQNQRAATSAARSLYASLEPRPTKKKSGGEDDGSDSGQFISSELFTDDKDKTEERILEAEKDPQQIHGYAIKVQNNLRRQKSHALTMLSAGQEVILNQTKTQMAVNFAAATTAEKVATARKTFRRYGQISATEGDKQDIKNPVAEQAVVAVKQERRFAINVGHLHTDAAGQIKQKTAAATGEKTLDTQAAKQTTKARSVWSYSASEDKTQVDVVRGASHFTAAARIINKKEDALVQARTPVAPMITKTGLTESSPLEAAKPMNASLPTKAPAKPVRAHAHHKTSPAEQGIQTPKAEAVAKSGTVLRVTTLPKADPAIRHVQPTKIAVATVPQTRTAAQPLAPQRPISADAKTTPRSEQRIPQQRDQQPPQQRQDQRVAPRDQQQPPQQRQEQRVTPREQAPVQEKPEERRSTRGVVGTLPRNGLQTDQRPIIVQGVQPPQRQVPERQLPAQTPERTERGPYSAYVEPRIPDTDKRTAPSIIAAPDRVGPDIRTAPGNGVPFIPAEAFRAPDSVVFLSSKVEIPGGADISQLLRNAQAGAIQPPAVVPAEVIPKVAETIPRADDKVAPPAPAAEQPAQRQKVATLPGPTIG